jgi:RHS repeat-associated protein
MSYFPFGGTYAPIGTTTDTNNMRFPGQYFLLESGLHYNWHRHYDPTLGRYTQPDPMEFVDGPSLYAYAKSAPTMEIDPSGMFVAPYPPVAPLLRPWPPVPFMGPEGPYGPLLHPQDKDPCAGLRKMLHEHEQKLRDYIADPYKYDNRNFLGQGRDSQVIAGRIRNLERQIAEFRKQLKECEERNERPQFSSYQGPVCTQN